MEKSEGSKKLENIENIATLNEIINFANLYNRVVNKSKNIYKLARKYTDKDIEKGKSIFIKELRNNRLVKKYQADDFEVENSALLTYATRKTLTEKKYSPYIKSLKKYLLARVPEIIIDLESTLEAHKKDKARQEEMDQHKLFIHNGNDDNDFDLIVPTQNIEIIS